MKPTHDAQDLKSSRLLRGEQNSKASRCRAALRIAARAYIVLTHVQRTNVLKSEISTFEHKYLKTYAIYIIQKRTREMFASNAFIDALETAFLTHGALCAR